MGFQQAAGATEPDTTPAALPLEFNQEEE